MHAPSLWALLIVLGLAFLLFGRPGRLSSMMEDIGKGIKGFRKGLTDADKPGEAKTEETPKQITDRTNAASQSTSEQSKTGS